jgi:mycothiol synthase
MEIRPYQGPDDRELLAVWNTAMASDRVSPQIFYTKVLLDPNFQPANLPVAVEDGRVVGFVLALTRRVPFGPQGMQPDRAWITAFGVHPDYRRRGIGSALFTHVLRKLDAEQRTTIAISPYEPNYFAPGIDVKAYPEALALLQRNFGFEIHEHAISMGMDLSNLQLPANLRAHEHQLRAEGITVQPFTPADLPDLMDFLLDEFGWGWYDFYQTSLLELMGGGSAQTDVIVARMDGKVVGASHHRNERFGPFGVRADLRNRGVGRVLLFRCLEAMAARHLYYAYFMWTEDEAARLYARTGFDRRREFAILQRVR